VGCWLLTIITPLLAHEPAPAAACVRATVDRRRPRRTVHM
jgi:hypothetical protein